MNRQIPLSLLLPLVLLSVLLFALSLLLVPKNVLKRSLITWTWFQDVLHEWNRFLFKLIPKAVKDSFDDAKQVGVEFDYRQPMKTSSIHQNAIAKVKALSGFSGDQELSFEVQRCLGEKVRNQFDLIRRRQKRDASLPEARTTFQVSERKRKRLQRVSDNIETP
ncbi:hypothetical protein BD560DRAFT_490384 [Blakeslea trispora]|nr:hypothetical protein BD560DRAFT_490384 [Blakeslea trispora]